MGPIIKQYAGSNDQSEAIQVYDDPLAYLFDQKDPRTTQFINDQNASTDRLLREAPLYESLVKRFVQLHTPDNLTMPGFGNNLVFKFQATPEGPKGCLFIAPLNDFLKSGEQTSFELLLDFNKLASDEGVDWFFAGNVRRKGCDDKILVMLSASGADAVTVREFNTEKRVFEPDGFQIKGHVKLCYIGNSNLIAFCDPNRTDNTSSSGYPLEVRVWDRTTKIADSRSLYCADPAHLTVAVSSWEITKGDWRLVIQDYTDIYQRDILVASPDTKELTRLPLPSNLEIFGVVDGVLFFRPDELFYMGGTDCQGALIAFNLAEFLSSRKELYTNVFMPSANQLVDDVVVAGTKLFISYYQDVISKLAESQFSLQDLFSKRSDPLEFREISLPGLGNVNTLEVVNGTLVKVGYTDFKTPQSYHLISSGASSLGSPFLQKPAKIDLTSVRVNQCWATSLDGTQIPYFILDGRSDPSIAAPTILYGYGGFKQSLLPDYNWINGAAWLAEGGIYVIANIRGGGEFGPKWHQAALKKNRNKAYEDFAAVAQALIDQGFCSAKQLGAWGASNGGLLVGNMFTTYPHLFGAIVCDYALLNMLRFHEFLKGPNWIGEYGDPSQSEDREWLKRYSPYHNLDATTVYPSVLFTTDSNDDRVHPGHARTLAALMQKLGCPDVFFYEKNAGGHAMGDFNSWIPDTAMRYTFFAKMLGLEK